MKNLLPLTIAIVLILIAGFGFYSALQSARDYVTVYAAKTPLAAYSYASPEEAFNEVQVTRSVAESNPEILTVDEYQEIYQGGGVYIIYPFLQNQFIVESGIASSNSTTLRAVLPEEKVIAVTTSITGAALGAIQSGDVVNVSNGSDGSAAQNAKVMCITVNPATCANVLAAGVALLPPASNNQSQSAGGVYALLAVPTGAADSLAGTDVSLILNPFCGIDSKGFLIDKGQGKCQDDGSGRVAKAVEDQDTTGTTTTPTTTTGG